MARRDASSAAIASSMFIIALGDEGAGELGVAALEVELES